MTDTPNPGEVWADRDPRELGRTVLVDTVDTRYAHCIVLTPRATNPDGRTGHRTRILLTAMASRYSPTGERR